MNLLMNAVRRVNMPMASLAGSILLLAAVLIFALIILLPRFRDEVYIGAHGRAYTGFRVFYLENDFFPENPVQNQMAFLMSFTDFVEVDSRFNLRLDREAEIFYNYSASKRFIIRYMGSLGGVANPIVFEDYHPLSTYGGRGYGTWFSFPPNEGGPGGTYTVHPKIYTDLYLDFVAAQLYMMYAENVIAQSLRGFSAEIVIEFRYNIIIPVWGINETTVQGYRLDLSSEIFTLTSIGGHNNAWDRFIYLTEPPPQITIPIAIIFIFAAAVGVYGLIASIGRLGADPNEARREASAILSKYSNEIVLSEDSLSLSDYRITKMKDFHALLKLAVILGKHIICYHDDEAAEFAVMVENSAYYFRIYFEADEK